MKRSAMLLEAYASVSEGLPVRQVTARYLANLEEASQTAEVVPTGSELLRLFGSAAKEIGLASVDKIKKQLTTTIQRVSEPDTMDKLSTELVALLGKRVKKGATAVGDSAAGSFKRLLTRVWNKTFLSDKPRKLRQLIRSVSLSAMMLPNNSNATMLTAQIEGMVKDIDEGTMSTSEAMEELMNMQRRLDHQLQQANKPTMLQIAKQ
jgi:hypothetical protein